MVFTCILLPAVLGLLGTFPTQRVGQPPELRQDGSGDTSIFAPLDVTPAPNVYRSASGAPGPKYWQNRADY
ncbi:MAG TPA: hypothetical protein VNU46_07500, partial [Gemmatimonadaceae bacterium]|nr:hypothetical protein [Gemmatimonadaceae bacterium]